MRIEAFDKIFECENEISAVENVFTLINELVAESNQEVRCLEIDGTELYGDFEQHLVENIETIKTIVVKVKTLLELMDDTLKSIQEYIERVFPEIDRIVDEFYQDVSSDTWNRFEQLLEGLQFIVNSLKVISENQEKYPSASQFALVKQNLLKRIILLHEALEIQDRVLICDVLLYEIIPSFKSLSWEIYAHKGNGQVH